MRRNEGQARWVVLIERHVHVVIHAAWKGEILVLNDVASLGACNLWSGCWWAYISSWMC